MRATDIIARKRDGFALEPGEIDFFVSGLVDGSIADYQGSALCMAIYLKGMDPDETVEWTRAILESGEKVDLSSIAGFKVDKHSTGGVGDKTTLVAVPVAASLGVKVAKMSGRALGHTGGTLDKLLSIPGFRVELRPEEMVRVVSECGMAVVGQTLDLVPADRILYELRDVTATIESIPLIASSIVSKKLASGADGIVLDVKCGAGAFIQEEGEARNLARVMVRICQGLGRRASACLSSMEQPLGLAVGNGIEVREAIRTLKGDGPADLKELSLLLAAKMVAMAGHYSSLDDALMACEGALDSGSALDVFTRFIEAQGGDSRVVEDDSTLVDAPVVSPLLSPSGGYIQSLDARAVGIASMQLGAGRDRKDESICYGAGIEIHKKIGDRVCANEPLATFHAALESRVNRASETYLSGLQIGECEVALPKVIVERDIQRD